MMQTILLKTDDAYKYWRLTDTDGREYWNITPRDSAPPAGGYKSKTYIEHIKHVTFE